MNVTFSNTSEPYFVAIKRNGATVKTWTGLTGEQNLSWNGNFMFTDRLQADGSYRIVATTEKQRDRVRDAQMVVLDTVGPVFTNSRIQKKNGGYRIQSAMSDKPSGIQPGTLSLAFQDAQGQDAGITGQLETENGVSLFVYHLQASEAQFNQLKAGELLAKTSVQDKAGNTANVNLNLGDAIFLQSARFLNSGDIEIKGTINANLTSVDISNIYPDFDGMLNFTDYQFNQDPQNKRRFTLIIPAGYTFSSQSENMIKSLSEESLQSFSIKVKAILAMPNQEPLISNEVEVNDNKESDNKNWEGNAQIESETNLLSIEESSQDFHTQSVFGIPSQAYAQYGKPIFSVGYGKAGLFLVGYNKVFNQFYSKVIRAQQTILVEDQFGKIVYQRIIKYP